MCQKPVKIQRGLVDNSGGFRIPVLYNKRYQIRSRPFSWKCSERTSELFRLIGNISRLMEERREVTLRELNVS